MDTAGDLRVESRKTESTRELGDIVTMQGSHYLFMSPNTSSLLFEPAE